MRLNIPLIAVRLQVTQIHQHQAVNAVVERRVAAKIDKLDAAWLAQLGILLEKHLPIKIPLPHKTIFTIFSTKNHTSPL